jgi:hypothetical protein
VRQNPQERGAAVVHIFRFDQDRIVELWDVGQPVPEKAVHENGMFRRRMQFRFDYLNVAAGSRFRR